MRAPCLVLLTLYLFTLLRSVQLSFTRFTIESSLDVVVLLVIICYVLFVFNHVFMVTSLEHLSASVGFSALPSTALPSQPPHS